MKFVAGKLQAAGMVVGLYHEEVLLASVLVWRSWRARRCDVGGLRLPCLSSH